MKGKISLRRWSIEKKARCSSTRVDWSAYATQYDLMADNNPAYQELLAHCVQTVASWGLHNGDIVADLAAGTGNFSLAIARSLPQVTVLHVELNEEMIAIAERKASQANVRNWNVVQLDLMDQVWSLPELSAVVLIHVLGTLPNPHHVIKFACAGLRKGGHLYAADVGRPISLADWGRELVCASLKKNGFKGTIKLLFRTGRVRRENRRGARLRRNNTYWSHDLPEFKAAFEEEGMDVSFSSNDFYRSYDDLVIATKP